MPWSWPGRVRTSTSSATSSGMVFTLAPPWAMLGLMVVWVQAWNSRAGAEGQLLQAVVDPVGVEQRRHRLVGQAHGVQVATPHLADLGLGPVGGDAPHHLGRLHQGVVGLVGLRAVAGGAPHGDAAPVAALLAHHHRQLGARRALHRDAAGLGEDVVGPHGVELVVGQVPGAPRAGGLLVGDGGEHQRAVGPPPACGQAADRHRHRRGEVQHVDRAPAPHLAVDQLAAEGVARPALLADRDDVEVAEQGERRAPTGRGPRCARRGSGGRAGARRPRGRGRCPRGGRAGCRPSGPRRRTRPTRRSRTGCG